MVLMRNFVWIMSLLMVETHIDILIEMVLLVPLSTDWQLQKVIVKEKNIRDILQVENAKPVMARD